MAVGYRGGLPVLWGGPVDVYASCSSSPSNPRNNSRIHSFNPMASDPISSSNPDQNLFSDPDPDLTDPAEEPRLGSLTLEEPGNPNGLAGSVSGSSLSADFYSGDETEIAVEEEEEGRRASAAVADVSSSRRGIAWGVNSERDGHASCSPSSSGYAGERGSSGASSGIEEVDDGVSLQDDWVVGKRRLDEDDASDSWRKRKKHFLVLSHSGKPIYSRYGDEHKLAGFSATLQAIISFVENGDDHIKFVRAGRHQVVFLVKGPIYLVCISCTEEPYEALKGQLNLIYGQILLILTKSVDRCFEKNPKFDMSPLLGGTDAVFSSLIHAFSWNPATFLHAYTCLPLAYSTRQAAGAILQDVADSGVLFAILMCKHKVVSLIGAQKASLHPDDMLLLANFILASESFRTSESFSPICLPRYNPMAFLYAYVHYLEVDTYLTLLTTRSDAFYHLKDCRIRIEAVLVTSNVLAEVQRSLLDGGLRVEDLPVDSSRQSGSVPPHLSWDKNRPPQPHVGLGGPAGLWHFMYRSIYLDQYVSSEFSSPINSIAKQKRLYRAYQTLYASMHDKGIGPHKTQYRRDEHYGYIAWCLFTPPVKWIRSIHSWLSALHYGLQDRSPPFLSLLTGCQTVTKDINLEVLLLCWITQDFELYAAFDPLADKASAIKACNRVCQWVRDLENEIFLLGASPFSW